MLKEIAFAKLNLTLDVIGKLPNGYHELLMVMESISLHDEIDVAPNNSGLFTMTTTVPWIPCDDRNLMIKAAKAFREKLGDATLGADFTLIKKTPAGAGMAGGSSDAAAVLRALNTYCGNPFHSDALSELALGVGSDVPYCLRGGSRLAKGRGEILSTLPMPAACSVVVVKPRFSISTPELFSRIDARKTKTHPDTTGIINAMEQQDFPGMARRMFNVFEDVLPPNCREILTIRGELIGYGAAGAIMTGTGSAVFGLFQDSIKAQNAAENLKKSYRDVFLTQFTNEL